ncbi:hypothetical protein AWB76_07184 [Caballeronia temeraria]|uniref:Uncharacterized protein n=1 Tax=Caballeronia temeraria TaxID=1777137 RepID=A0A158DMF2_9BURK|nr:hypothetical protein [Caballeronia temeraria]SAK95735.1 hypothetical protein AWB76_07184 [Caballeronia temeraria]
MSNEFKVGDKVRLKAEYKVHHPEAFHGRLTVDSGLGSHWGVTAADGKQAGFFLSELEADGFRVGDRVVAPGWSCSKVWSGVLTVEKDYDGEGACFQCANPTGVLGAFGAEDLEFAPALEAVESEPEAQPVTYRICVNNTIGKTEYPSLEAAKAAALLHGSDGEEFSIWEVVQVAEYKVKVTKSLEPVEAA